MSEIRSESQGALGQFTRHAAAAAAVALLGGFAALPAQAEVGEQSMSSVAPDSTTGGFLFTGTPRVVISDHGNLLRFEGPTGYDHVGVGALSEGYVLCYGATRVWDTGSSEFGFGPATRSCTATSCTVTRNTSDGRFRLRQLISKTAPERSLDVEMTLTRLGPGTITGVILRRQVDLDVDTGGPLGTGDFTNRFSTSERDSVFAWNAPNDNAGEGHAVVLRHLRRTPTSVTYAPKVTSSILDNTCNPANIAAAGPVIGDYGASIQYNVGTMGQGATFVGRVQYERN
jgi:hypothetical protein